MTGAGESEPAIVPDTSAAPDPAEIQAERDKFKDLAYRSAAELENYRRRSAKEREELAGALKERFAAQLLPILDALDLAQTSIGGEVPAELKKYLEGYQAIGRQILSVMDRMGLAEIEIGGEAAFRPEDHEAVLTEPVPGLKEPTVLQVLQKGYRMDGRLIRPARVKVGMPA